MGQRDFGLLLVPVVALLAVLVPTLGAPEKNTSPVGSPSADESVPSPQLPPRTAAAMLKDYSYVSSPVAANCLIATLPDPVDAGNLNYTYDRYFDALQRAAEAAGFVLDRYDLPWLDKPAADPKTEPRFRREPGRLLFRQTGSTAPPSQPSLLPSPTQLASAPAQHPATEPKTDRSNTVAGSLIVFVVGETPTSGIHKAAFETALSEIDETCSSTEGNPIKLMGPSFSGAQESLIRLMHYFPSKAFKIVSGSATAINVSAIQAAGGKGTTFRTTVARDDDARSKFLEVIRQREEARTFEHIRHWLRWLRVLPAEHRLKVALLFESNTAFGQSAATQSSPDPGSGLTLDVIRLAFPLHIASLRVASSEAGSPETAKSERAVGMTRLTKLDLRDPVASNSVIPLMSHIENPSMEIVLNTLLRTLQEEHVRYIGLVATDVRDRIFLTQQIRHHLPNSTVFMFSADLLYVHPDVNVDLRGVEVVTSYPLFSANQLWTAGAGRARLLFPTHTTEGVYNAMLALLNHPELMQEYGYPFDEKKGPALWLSVVGAESLQPTQVLGEASAEAMIERQPSITSSSRTVSLPDHPWLATLAFVLCVIPGAYAVFNVGSLEGFARRAARIRANFVVGRLATLFSETIYTTHTLPRHLYRFAGWTALSSAYALTMTTFLLPPMANAHLSAATTHLASDLISPLFLIVLLVGFFIMLAMVVVLGIGVWHQGDPATSSRKLIRHFARVGIGIGSLALFALSIGVCWHWTGLAASSPVEGVMLYIRSADFSSGVSPLLPMVLICGAAIAWSVSSLRRLRLLEGPDQYPYASSASGSDPNSFLGFQGSSLEGIASLEREVLNAIGRQSTSLPWPVLIVIVCLLLIAWIRLFGPRAVPTGEGWQFDGLFALGFLTVYAGLGLSFLRFVFIWRKLARLLQRLAWHPTVKAYARLGQVIPGKPRINLTAPSQILTALEFSVDRAGQLAALGRELVKSAKADRRFTGKLGNALPNIEGLVQTSETELHLALNAEAERDWVEEVKCRTRAEQALSRMATSVTELVRPAWRLPATDAPERGKEEPTETEWIELAEDFLTSRVAAFLSHVVPQLQNLIIFVTAGLLLMLLAVTSYPFQPHQLLLLFNTAVILSVVGTTLVVFIQMERETILSVLSDSTPGKIDWNRDFISRVVVYVGVPIISLLGAQFPEVAQQLFSWTSSFFGTH